MRARLSAKKSTKKNILARQQRARGVLELERNRVRAMLASVSQSRLSDEPGEGKRTNDCLGRNRMLNLINDNRGALLRRLHRIDEALQRLEDGSYGKCLKCGERIDRRILKNDPASAYCHQCQSGPVNNGLPPRLREML